MIVHDGLSISRHSVSPVAGDPPGSRLELTQLQDSQPPLHPRPLRITQPPWLDVETSGIMMSMPHLSVAVAVDSKRPFWRRP